MSWPPNPPDGGEVHMLSNFDLERIRAEAKAEGAAEKQKAILDAIKAAADDAEDRGERWMDRGNDIMAGSKAQSARDIRELYNAIRARGEKPCEQCNGTGYIDCPEIGQLDSVCACGAKP